MTKRIVHMTNNLGVSSKPAGFLMKGLELDTGPRTPREGSSGMFKHTLLVGGLFKLQAFLFLMRDLWINQVYFKVDHKLFVVNLGVGLLRAGSVWNESEWMIRSNWPLAFFGLKPTTSCFSPHLANRICWACRAYQTIWTLPEAAQKRICAALTMFWVESQNRLGLWPVEGWKAGGQWAAHHRHPLWQSLTSKRRKNGFRDEFSHPPA